MRGVCGAGAELYVAVLGAEHKDGEEPAGQGNGPASAMGTAWSEDWGHVTRCLMRMLCFLAHATPALSLWLPVFVPGLLPIHPCTESMEWIL